MEASNAAKHITLLFGMIPPPKKKKAAEIIKPPEPEPETEPENNGEEKEGGEGEAPLSDEPPAEPEPEVEPDIEPRSILMNSNVPVAIILHHARKAYIKSTREEPVVSMETPWFHLDFATEEGGVVGLGNEEALNDLACEKGLEPRATYILVKKEVDAEGTAFYKYLGTPPTRFRETEFRAP